jgi:hypothetical protein
MTPALAQLRSSDAMVSWFSSSDCKADLPNVKTLVVLSQGVCQRVPGDAAFPGYRVFCNDGELSGRIEYCRDTSCTNCTLARPFLGSSSCLPNDASSFGAASYNIRCPSPIANKKTEAIAEAIALAPSTFLIQWNAAATCATDNVQRTLVIGVQDLCQRVPASSNGTGYKIKCNTIGGGVISFCSTPDCSRCESQVPFLMGQCLQNDARLAGSASYSLSCPSGNAGANGGGAGRTPVLPPFVEVPRFPPTLDAPKVSISTSLPSEGGKNGGIKIVIISTPTANNSITVGGLLPTQTPNKLPVSPVIVIPNTQQPKASVLPGATTALPVTPVQPKTSVLPGAANALPVSPVVIDVSQKQGASSSIAPGLKTMPWDTDYSSFPIIGARPQDFRATWFYEPGCTTSAGQYTGVVGTIQFCNAVPRSVDSGYFIKCLTDPTTGANLPSGTFHVCQDYPTCNSCDTIIPFRDDQCLTQQSLQSSRSQFGVASADFQCTNPLIPDALPAPGRALLAWFEGADCNPAHRTLVDIRQDVCNRVPRGQDGGYKVTCSEDGSVGLYEICDSTCEKCTVSTRFASDQCLSNPKEFGSESVSIRCSKFAAGNSTMGQGPKLGQSLPEQVPSINTPSPSPVVASGAAEISIGLLSIVLAALAVFA